MRLTTAVLLLAALFGAYRWWDGRSADAAAAAVSGNGFVPVHMPDGAPRRAVLVLAPPNCPSEQARRAEALVSFLEDKGVPVVRGDSIAFDVANPSADQVAAIDRAVAVFKAGAPAVFVGGMAMSNPTPAQALAEYRRTR